MPEYDDMECYKKYVPLPPPNVPRNFSSDHQRFPAGSVVERPSFHVPAIAIDSPLGIPVGQKVY